MVNTIQFNTNDFAKGFRNLYQAYYGLDKSDK